MNRTSIVSLTLRLLVACYAYMMIMASANVASCEVRKPGQCGNQWTQAFTVAGGAASTMWAYITDSPNTTKNPTTRRRNVSRPE